MRISDWSSDVCSSDLKHVYIHRIDYVNDSISTESKKFNNFTSLNLHYLNGLIKIIEAILKGDMTLGYLSSARYIRHRWEERRVGNECVSPCSYRWSRDH